jgi:PIN domain nuclease of toxin-antitoxin system
MGPMKLLLDTHTLYSWHRGDSALSMPARAAISDSHNEKYVSAITAWELNTKFRSGKQPEFAGIATDVAAVIAAHGSIQLPITMRHAHVAAMTIVTVDRAFASYAAKLLW